MGLHLDIDQVLADNLKKEGSRKWNKILVNIGDKLTREERKDLIKANREMYGLPQEYID
jgi:hypothetical protein